MRLLALAAAVLALAAPVSAQPIPIHGHPQKAFYASSAECTEVDSQGWEGNSDPLLAGHVHIIAKFCDYMVVTSFATFEVPFKIKLHDYGGTVTSVGGEHIRSVRWEDTGSSQMPLLYGGPNELKEFHGVATIDLSLGDDGFLHIFKFPLHGWSAVRFVAISWLDSGLRRIDNISSRPLYSMIDPSSPVIDPPQQGNPGTHISNSMTVWDSELGAMVGEVFMELTDYIPLAPITAPWTYQLSGYNYTAPVTVPQIERFERRRNPDLHNGVRGTLVQAVDIGEGRNRQIITSVTIDPTGLPAGVYKEMDVWTQPLGDAAFSSVVVFPYTVGVGVPSAPTLCADPTATNVGQPLPCTFPPPIVDVCPNLDGVQATVPDGLALVNGQCVVPTPIEAWVTKAAVFQQLEINGVPQNRWKVCAAGVCSTEFVFKP